jgi:hypothetical protein
MTGEDWNPNSNMRQQVGDSSLEWVMRYATVDAGFTMDETLMELRRLPEKVFADYFQFCPSTPAEAAYCTSLSHRYKKFFSYLIIQYYEPDSSHLGTLPPESKALLKIQWRNHQSWINLGAKLMKLCRPKFHNDCLPASLWYDLEFAGCAREIWNSGVLTGFQRSTAPHFTKDRLVKSMRSAIGEAEKLPYLWSKQDSTMAKVMEGASNFLDSIQDKSLEEQSKLLTEQFKLIFESASAIKERQTPSRFFFTDVCGQRPWILECLDAQAKINPFFLHQDEAQEVFHARRALIYFIRKHPGYL